MKLIAHRSGPVMHPEQTVAAARYAMSKGADMVEIDVRLTSEGAIAVSHDENLFRVFGADVNIGDITAEEFLRLRHREAPAYGAHLLKDYLDAQLPLLIHVKEARVLPALLEAVSGCTERVVLGVATPDEVRNIRSFSGDIRILSFSSRKDIPHMIASGVDYLRLWETWLDPETVSLVRENECALWVMSGDYTNDTVGEPEEAGLARILSLSPDGILINNIEKCL